MFTPHISSFFTAYLMWMKCIVKKQQHLDILKVWSHLPLFYQFAQVNCSHFNRNPRELEFEIERILGSS